MKKGRLFVFSGASGVGKGTVLEKVMAARGDLKFSVSATTRQPRKGEIEGVHYYFVTKEHFEEMIARDEFLEYDAHMKNYYGTPVFQLEEKLEGGHVLLDIEPNGAFAVKEKRPDAVLIFIAPPSMEELEHRLRGRGDTPEDQICIRMERAIWEMSLQDKYNYVVVNDTVDRCVEEILHIIAREAHE